MSKLYLYATIFTSLQPESICGDDDKDGDLKGDTVRVIEP